MAICNYTDFIAYRDPNYVTNAILRMIELLKIINGKLNNVSFQTEECIHKLLSRKVHISSKTSCNVHELIIQ